MSDARHDSNVNLKTRTNQLQATCVLTTTIMICVLIAIIALIISAVAISKPVGSEITVQGETTITQQTPQPAIAYSPSTYDASWCQASNRRRIYTVAAGYDIGPYEYNDDSGFQVGFGHDLIDAVCQEAGIDCRIVTEPYTNCMFSEKGQPERGGIGLISGFFTNEACLAGLDQVAGRDVPHSNVFQAETLDMLLAMILNGTVDVGLSTGPAMATKINGTNIQRFPSDPMFCKNAGQPGMMTRKDNDFNSKWNEGFEKLVSSGRFKRLCDEARIKHGHRGEIDCVDA
ncbi:uncharacterized protein LOC106158025 isoform X2 [Lingula anatina]|uniref:Uncharacterized protein LOC106158025 isoform X2 n=1 Tax=Lingula anatina TaxID=7574 RepID=A0A1S3HTE9_LINAN|nr:uncharacterized protein LOC106158025 isoform X2 [Lingula anatina]|eukprot:XP_013389312.1 uncharacterized protein LOC106158025 isoform X2 [Lingula anatina]